jgi:hypothetical protein
LSKPIDDTMPRMNPNEDCGLWVIIRVKVGLSIITNEPLGCGETIHVEQDRVAENSLNFLLSFAVNSKAVLKMIKVEKAQRIE